ncbi:SDR family NAD(P)-dependent oxidoreductase [Gordonia sp. CPCC 206044]|uniref:SDR family NAD(P)-dependent oxidoreductase n=1 Tax=Gordonia sp. CPCC 206044 TaxID=3140793 RepID=UPI003AF382D8
MTADGDLAGRCALVTGAGQGVGRGLALALADAGAEVLVNDVRVDRAEDVVAQVRDKGGRGRSVPFDVTDHEEVATAIAAAGPVDILINNAGNAGAGPFTVGRAFHDTGPADWEPFLRVNLYGVMHCTHAVLPAMIERQWGRVITIVSDAGRTGDRNSAVYATAKAGAAGFIRSIAMEGGRHGITANNIALGTMRTPLTEALWDEPDSPRAKAILQNYVIRRPGTPDDVAALALLLAGDQGSWITGQTIPVNGGYSFAL